MGGETTEMSSTTTHVFIEVASWDPVSSFRTERRHKMPSEAGKRFERGVDPTIPLVAADRVVELLTTYGGGTVEPGVTCVGARADREPIPMTHDLPARVTGMDIGADDGRQPASRRAARSRIRRHAPVTPPPWRPDLTDPFDLVEEVARIVGYVNVPSVLPPAAARSRADARASGCGAGSAARWPVSGFVEVISFPFIGTQDLDALGLPADDPRRQVLRLANPLSSEEPAMTTTLLPGLLTAVARNAGRGNADVALFETATVTLPRATGPAPILASTAPDRRRVRRAQQGASRPAAAPRPGRRRATASPPAGGARGVRPPGPTPSTAYAVPLRRSASR